MELRHADLMDRQIIAADGNPSGGVQSAIHRRATELLLVEHASSRMCRRWLG